MADGATRRPWTRDEQLVVFRLYCQTPFSRLDHRNPEIIALSKLIGRTPGAVAMKACNFANLDPTLRERGICGLQNTSKADRDLWDEFARDASSIALQAGDACVRLFGHEAEPLDVNQIPTVLPEGPTEVERVVRARRIQGFFRGAVLAAYEYRCALSGLAIPKLLIASHIVPWKDSPELRADPRNGICLNALYDRAFDRGLITFDEALHVIVSPAIRDLTDETGKALFRGIEDAQLRKPAAFAPDVTALRYHRERVFGG